MNMKINFISRFLVQIRLGGKFHIFDSGTLYRAVFRKPPAWIFIGLTRKSVNGESTLAWEDNHHTAYSSWVS